MKDTESTDLIYQLESKSFFLYLAGRKKEFQQLLYVDYFHCLENMDEGPNWGQNNIKLNKVRD